MVGGELVRAKVRTAATYAAAPLGRTGQRPARRFVIYCPPRTGSDLLVSLLDAHPSIRCEGEILATPVTRPLTWFDGRSALASLRGTYVWGCKIITQHLQWYPNAYGPPGELLRALVDRGYTIVHIRRRDWLLQALSLVHAAETKYHFTAGEDVRFERMTVDTEQLVYFLYAIEEQERLAETSLRGLPRLELCYEDDLRTPERQAATMDRLADVFAIPRVAVESDVVPGAPPTLGERVANLDEVAELLSRTRYARFLQAAVTADGVAP
jgi:LPS sulfotransferase NodH